MDNLLTHHSVSVKSQLEKFKWPVVYNAPYSPEFNSNKYYFNLVKKNYKDGLIAKDFELD